MRAADPVKTLYMAISAIILAQLSASFSKGLEDVVAGETSLCFIDGREGRLLYRGIDIFDLAEHSTFEEVAYLLWHAKLPRPDELSSFQEELGGYRKLPQEALQLLRSLPKASRPMSMLRTLISFLSHLDPDAESLSTEANLRVAMKIVARMPTIIAGFDRLRRGAELVPPDSKLPIAWDFLRMLNGSIPDELSARIFDVCLILHADHEFNASTFAARVTISTLSDMYSAVTSAIGALKGPLHGGANEAVMRFLQQIGSMERAEERVKGALDAKQKIMGFGHRVYKTEDPRATILRKFTKQLGEMKGETGWYEITRKVEEVVFSERKLYPNVDLYSASVYYYLGIPMDIFTPIFAMARASGWTAHVMEQLADNRLIRPAAIYKGPTHEPYIPITERK